MRPDPADLSVRHLTPGEDFVLPRLDIVIVNWNAGALLRTCLESLAGSACHGLLLDRVVVVDNASCDISLEALVRPAPQVTIRNARNVGFAAACNQGAAGSTADYLLFLNPDVILDPDSLAGAIAFMEAKENQEIDISGIRLRDAEGRTQRCCARFPTPARMVGHAVALDKLAPRLAAPHFLTDWDHEDSRDVPQVMGAFLLIRRAAFERLGGFDERFFLYYEDVDLCYRLVRDGGRCAHNAAVSAMHVGGGTTNAIKARRQFLAAQSRILYTKKHFGPLAAAAVGLAALIGEPALRLLRGAARRSRREIIDSAKGAFMLWRALPGMLRPAGKPANPGARPSVLVLTRYPRQGASSRTRFLAFLPALREAGLTIEVSPFFDETYLERLYGGRRQRLLSILASYGRRIAALRRIRSFDLVWIEKEALPWLPLALERRLLRRVPFVLDYDDAWFLRYAGHPLRPLLRGKLDGLIRDSRATLVGNEFLGAWAQRAGARQVVELPTLVAFERYRARPTLLAEGPLQIGWIGTPSSAELYLKPLMPVLAEAVRQGWANLTVVGAKDPALAAIGPVTFLPWSEEAEIDCLHRFDVGIMPLADDAWSQGKCAYKLIQYMAVGLPVVASPIGMNRKVVSHGENGFLAATAEEWLSSLRRLAEDPDLRRRMGEAGRLRVERDFALDPAIPRLIEALRAAAGR
jgi:GT2 family glycosyltransferase/glycosyltransferase involved in cell wall biosynthesis